MKTFNPEIYDKPVTYIRKCDFPALGIYGVEHEGVYINHGRVDNLPEIARHIYSQRNTENLRVHNGVVGWHFYSKILSKPVEHHVVFRKDSTQFIWAHEETHALHGMNQLELLDKVFWEDHKINMNLKRFKEMRFCKTYKKEFIADVGGMMSFLGQSNVSFSKGIGGMSAKWIDNLFEELCRVKGTGLKPRTSKILRQYRWAHFKLFFKNF